MRLSRDRAGKLWLVLASVLGCLVGGELFMRQLHPVLLPPSRDTRTEKARLYGWASKPGERLSFVDPETGERFFERANSEGWRDVEHTFEKAKGRVRVLFVGDSFTFGTVPFAALYTRRVEAKLHEMGYPSVEVISIGVGGWGPDQELEVLRNEGVRYDPDLVIYQFCSNDIANIDPPPAVAGDMSLGTHKPFRYVAENGRLRRIDRHSVEAARSAGVGGRLRHLFRTSALFRSAASLVPEKDEPAPPVDARQQRNASIAAGRFTIDEYEKSWSRAGWKLFEALLVEMRAVSSGRGAQFLVFSEAGEPGMRRHLLDQGELFTENGEDFALLGGRRLAVDMQLPLVRLAGVCARNGIPLIGPKRTYERYRKDWHADRAGNESMASDIVDFLVAWPPFLRLVASPVTPAAEHGRGG